MNKVYYKDNFPLPKIDLIVDTTSKHELISFMDAFYGYYQIKMHPQDIEKTSFIMGRGLVNKMFKNLIGDTMEVYINDMLAKSLKAINFIAHLEKTFQDPMPTLYDTEFL